MSLISLQDQEIAIEALELYLDTLQNMNGDNKDLVEVANTQALLNWIRLEYFKAKRKSGS
jgi:hypothetical protein